MQSTLDDLSRAEHQAGAEFGPACYDTFAGELAAYAYPVLLAWIRRAVIFKYCADKDRPVRPTDADREVLAGSFDDRLDLALETGLDPQRNRFGC